MPEDRLDIEVRARGADQANRKLQQTERTVRSTGRATRSLFPSFLGGALLGGFLSASLLDIATSGSTASNAMYRVQGALESLFNKLIEGAIGDAAIGFLDWYLTLGGVQQVLLAIIGIAFAPWLLGVTKAIKGSLLVALRGMVVWLWRAVAAIAIMTVTGNLSGLLAFFSAIGIVIGNAAKWLLAFVFRLALVTIPAILGTIGTIFMTIAFWVGSAARWLLLFIIRMAMIVIPAVLSGIATAFRVIGYWIGIVIGRVALLAVRFIPLLAGAFATLFLNPVGLIILAIIGFIAALIFLELRFKFVSKSLRGLKSLWDDIWFGIKVTAVSTINYIIRKLNELIGFINRTLRQISAISIGGNTLGFSAFGKSYSFTVPTFSPFAGLSGKQIGTIPTLAAPTRARTTTPSGEAVGITINNPIYNGTQTVDDFKENLLRAMQDQGFKEQLLDGALR